MKKIVFILLLAAANLGAGPMPEIVRTGRKASLLVDGKPFIILGAQVNNSSGWPSSIEALLSGAEAMLLNTLEVPVYWEDVEPEEGRFRFETFDNIIRLARGRNLHLVMLWFGTWKNGTMDYAPAWVKANTERFPRMMDAGGRPVRVLTPLSDENLNADRRAFAQVMRHLKAIDGEQHTVILVQVENEPGSLFTDRDHSASANEKFAGPVPAKLVEALGRKTWNLDASLRPPGGRIICRLCCFALCQRSG